MTPPVLWILLVGFATSAPLDHPNRVIYLPGAPIEPVFPLYSGFLQVSEGSAEHSVFYVLAEAIRADPSEVPLIVWMNGGPGASSLIGFLLEHGPYLIDSNTGQLTYNDFSWNQYANVLYIESPSGVGFSYSRNDTSRSIDDGSTARLNRKALQEFMTRVHAGYATRDFYLSGESYAGAYIPHLTREILNHTIHGEFTNKNFKGIAMGNAAVDDFSNNVAASIQLYGMGIIPETDGDKLFALWNQTRSKEAKMETNEFYNIFYSAKAPMGNNAVYDVPVECNREEDAERWHIAKPAINVECQWETLTETYLNREEVQHALHVRTKERPVVHWASLNNQVYFKFYQDVDTIPVYRDIVDFAQDGFRILFYTGDMDLICPPLQVAFGTRRIAEKNGMEVDTTSPTNWSYLGDFGGARTSYQATSGRISMDVITVRGSGHLVPLSQPDRAFQITNNFITAEPGTAVDYSKMIPRR